jgi:hypothetical protein
VSSLSTFNGKRTWNVRIRPSAKLRQRRVVRFGLNVRVGCNGCVLLTFGVQLNLQKLIANVLETQSDLSNETLELRFLFHIVGSR